MYTLVIDKPDIFEATVSIEGADSSSAKCRLIVESKTVSMIFEGDLDGNRCKIPMKNLKKYMNDGDVGKLRLEVIADDMFFSPWESEYKAKVSKKVTVEVNDPSKTVDVKPKVVVSEVSTPTKKHNRDILIHEMSKEFKIFKLKLEDVHKRKKTINHVVRKMIDKKIISDDMKDSPELINTVLEAIILSEK